MLPLKRLLIYLVCLALLLTMTVSCSKSGYSDGMSCEELTEEVLKAWADNRDYSDHNEDYLKYFFDEDTYHDDFRIVYTSDANDIDEIGIFHAPDDNSAEEIYDTTEHYIEEMREDQRAFIGSYAPSELPKLDGAKVKTYGKYVVYVIADVDRIDIALSTVEEALK